MKDKQQLQKKEVFNSDSKLKPSFFKKHKKKIKIAGIILGVILIGSIGISFYFEQQSNQNAHDYSPNFPSKTDLKGTIVSVYDGDQSINPQISIFNRVIKVTLELESSYNIELGSKEQITLVSNGQNYSPISYNNISLPDHQKTQVSLYFELSRDYKPELIVIRDNDLYNDLEIPIDVKATYYSINKDLKLVFDDDTNIEYQNLKNKLEALVSGKSDLKEVALPNIDLLINLPSLNTSSFLQSSDRPISYGDGDPGGYDPGNSYYGPSCQEIDTKTLTPIDKEVKCKLYSISYDVYTDKKLVGISRTIQIFYNSYPYDLVGILGSHDDLNEEEVSILGKSVKMIQVKDSSTELLFTAIKVDDDNIYVIKTSKYLGYSEQVPIEIYNLERQLMFKVIKSLKYKIQKDIIEEIEETTTPTTLPTPTVVINQTNEEEK